MTYPTTLSEKLDMARRLLDTAEQTLLRAGHDDMNDAMRLHAHSVALSNLEQLLSMVHRAEMDLALTLIRAPFAKSEDVLHGYAPSEIHPNPMTTA